MNARSPATPVTQSSVLSPQSSGRPQSIWRIRQRRREAIEGFLFIAPAVIGFLAFTLLLSDPEWIGLDNYVALAKDEFFWRSLRITATYAVVGLPLGLLFALLVALLLNQQVPGISIDLALALRPAVGSLRGGGRRPLALATQPGVRAPQRHAGLSRH
jgi:ABC-type Fe3+ transport system permease subunit